MPAVSSTDIANWARGTTAPFQLGELMRRLIRFSYPHLNPGDIDFHANKYNTLPGWDGKVCLSGAGEFSVWEIGVVADGKAKAKVQSDFEKRLNASEHPLPSGWTHANTVYNAVVPFDFDVVNFENELKAIPGSLWKDVKIWGLAQLEQWIETAPPVEVWFVETTGFGKLRFGRTLGQFANEWCNEIKPPVPMEMLLAGRPTDALKTTFHPTEPGSFVLHSDSPQEAIAFLYAMLVEELPGDVCDRVLARTLVIDDEAFARNYALERFKGDPPITILVPPANAHADTLENAGHYVIVAASGSNTGAGRPLVKLRRALLGELAEAFEKHYSFDADTAEREARTCAGSLTAYAAWKKKERSGLPEQRLPPWATISNAAMTIPAIFAGAWNEHLDLDRDALASLSERSGYDQYLGDLLPFFKCQFPLLERVQRQVVLASPVVSFILNSDYITSRHLEKLEEVIKRVYSHIDEDEQADYEGSAKELRAKEPSRHSDSLKSGLAECLLKLSFFADRLNSQALARKDGSIQAYVNRLVGEITGLLNNPTFAYSLRRQLPTLAESAPRPFVAALGLALQGAPDKWQQLLNDGGMFGPVKHTGLLWALETIAWDPEILDKASECLLRLAKLDPGGSVSNRPLNTLRSIYLAWKPGTSAGVAQRIGVLRGLSRVDEQLTWKLLTELLPKSHDTVNESARPSWKDFGRSTSVAITDGGTTAFVGYIALTLDMAEGNVERLLSILDDAAFFDMAGRQRYQACLKASLESPHLSRETALQARETLRAFVAKQKRFLNTAWVHGEEDIGQFEALLEKLTPGNFFEENRWLFDDSHPDLGEPSLSIEDWIAKLALLRRQCIEQLWKAEGIEGLLAFARAVRFPFLVLEGLSNVPLTTEDALTMLSRCAKGDVTGADWTLLNALSKTMLDRQGNAWTVSLLEAAHKEHWPPKALATALQEYPRTSKTFDLVKAEGRKVQEQYWRQVRVYLGEIEKPDVSRFVRELLKRGRALEVVGQPLSKLPTAQLRAAIDRAFNDLQADPAPRIDNMLSYHLNEAFAVLRKRRNVTLDDMAAREWAFFPVLYTHGSERCEALHEKLAKDPELFVELLGAVYFPKEAIGDAPPPSAEERKRAQIGWRVLRSWRTIPGQGTKKFDQLTFRTWVEKARDLAERAGRGEAADSVIGQTLAHMKPDDTGDWPPQPLCHLLEDLASERIESGLSIGIYNSRGVTTRGVMDGGAQERDLANLWEARAARLKETWPRASRFCERVSKQYKNEAEGFDQSAEARWLQATR